MNCETTVSLKQGATFSLTGTVLLPDGDWTAECQIRTADGVEVATCAVALEPLVSPTATASHSVVIDQPDTDSADWPVGPQQADVVFVAADPAIVNPSNTFVVKVAKRITRV